MTPDRRARLAERLTKFRGRYDEISKATKVKYSTVRKLACGALENPGEAITKPVLAWMKGRRP